MENIVLDEGACLISSLPYIKYLGVAKASFKHRVKHAVDKTARLEMTLTLLLPNIGDFRQNNRKLLASVVSSS